VNVAALATYRPVWEIEGGGRSCGHDEDVTTLAVAAAAGVLAPCDVGRVVIVTDAPDVLEPDPGAVFATALGLAPATPVEVRLGAGAAALEALARAAPRTVVVAVSPSTPAGAAGALVGDEGVELTDVRSAAHSLPALVRRAASSAVAVYDDPRLVRERAVRPAVAAVANGAAPVAVAGVAPGDLGRLLPSPPLAHDRVGGAAEPLFALAALLDAGRTGPLVAVEGARATSVEVGRGAAPVARSERAPLPAAPAAETESGSIPFSLPAYARAFDAKVGLVAARCACGELSYPPRSLCLACGRTGATTPERLPRRGAVYTTVTVRTAVPGIPGPYSLAIAALDGVETRVTVPVTDAPAGSVRIDDRGELVLRRIATRAGVPDYGYAFVPDEVRR
jgi:uncharacterized protein